MASEKKEKQDSLPMTFFKAVGITLLAVGLSLVLFQPFSFSAASGEETALPYVEKNHGMFTYYLLKKLQESKGGATLRELSDYVIKNVKHQSNFVNNKPQTPTVRVSGRMESMWNSKKLRP
ncbi:MAG: hypothetical protein K1V78_07005 [Muribaculaceae bacterium]